MLNSDNPHVTPNQHYHNRDVAHAEEVNYEKNRYITPINVEFGSTESDSTVNIASKYRKLFTAIKVLDPSAKIITDDDTVIHHPKEFPWELIMQQNSQLSTIAQPDFPVFCPPRRNDCECTYIDKPLSEDIGCENQTGDRCITTEECEKNTNEPKIYSYTKKIRKCNDCISKFAGQPLCDDIGCKILEEGKCMTTSCQQYAKKYPGYPCNDEVCKDKESGYSYTTQPLYEDIGRVYKKDSICLTKVECDKHMNAYNGYNCNTVVCNGNDC